MASTADIRAWKAQAAQAVARGEVRQALDLYAQLADAEPAEPEWRVRAAESFQTLGERIEAARAYRDAATLFARAGFELRAVAACRAALQLQPDEPETARLLAVLVPGAPAPPSSPAPRDDDGHSSLQQVDITSRLRAVNPDAVRTDHAAMGFTDVALDPDDVDDPGYTDLVLDDLAEIQEVSGPSRTVHSARPAPAVPSTPPRKPTPPPIPATAGPAVRKPTPPPIPSAAPGPPGAKPTPPPVTVRSGVAPKPPAAQPKEVSRSILDQFDALDASDDLFAPRPSRPATRPNAVPTPPAPRASKPAPASPVTRPSGSTPAVRPEPARPPAAASAPAAPPGKPVDPAVLKGLPLLGTLPPEVLETFVRRIRQITIAPGDRVISEGEIADTVYLVVRGDLVAARGTPPRPLARLGEGTFFGEMALLDDAPRSASVVAVTDAELLALPRDLVLEICDRYPTVLEKLMQSLRARLIATLTTTSPLFQSIPPAERPGIVAKFRLREIEVGTEFIREGRRADGLFVILTGRAEVSIGGSVIALLTTGDVAGEISLLSQGGASASVTARTRLATLMLPANDLQEIIMVHPEVLEHLSSLSDTRRSVPPGEAPTSTFPAMNVRRV